MDDGKVSLSTLQAHVRKTLVLKHDLGLFYDPFIPETVNSQYLTTEHEPIILEVAQKSIVLLENRNNTLPLNSRTQNISKIAFSFLRYAQLRTSPSASPMLHH